MLDVILDALVDTLKVVPILLLVYLLIEYLTHHKEQPFSFVNKHGKRYGALIGAALGTIPQCGFSSAMADLYADKKITLGTLFAVFIATSDEAIPILIANPSAWQQMLILLATKFAFALLFGYLIDFVVSDKIAAKINAKKKVPEIETLHHDDCHCHEHDHKHDHHENCECHHSNSECGHEHCCANNIFIEAIIHTLKISAFILIINLVLGIIIYYTNLETFVSAISINKYLQPLVTCLIGLIPNCAGSVLLVELYLEGGITLAATIGGLSAGSGMGILILFRKNRNIKENILILISLYLIGVIIGTALTPILA